MVDNELTSDLFVMKISPESREMLRKGLELHGLKEVPGSKEDPLLITDFIRSTRGLIQDYGEDWIKQHRTRLVKELEILATM
jgi:hypothetical protein